MSAPSPLARRIAGRAATAAAALLLVGACRPVAPQGSGLLDGPGSPSASSVSVAFSADGSRTVLRPERSDVRLAELKELALFDARKARFTTPKAKQYVSLGERLQFGLTLTLADNRTCRSAAGSGIALKGSAALSCDASPEQLAAQVRELKDVCRELAAADAGTAEFVDGRDYCLCLKRREKRLAYADYRGQRARFRLECRNAATAEELRAICGEIRDRYCKTCRVETLSCECPKSVALTYSAYTDDPERFQVDCLREADFGQEFEDACRRIDGSIRRDDAGRVTACKCKTGDRSVTLDDWKSDRATLGRVCDTVPKPPGG